MNDGMTAPADGASAKSTRTSLISLSRIELALAAIAVLIGLVASARLLLRGVFFDEFFTLAMTDPGQSFDQFYALLEVDAHPFLYFIIVWVERLLGIDTVAVMRMANFAGWALIGWSVWFAMRNQVMTRAQAIALIVVCATSNIFLDAIGELRPYYLVGCAMTAASVTWLVVWNRVEAKGRLTRGLMLAWAVPVGVAAMLNYFAMAMCGLMAGALVMFTASRRDVRGSMIIGGASLAAVVLALINVAIQGGHQPHHFWIDTTPKQAAELFVLNWRGMILNNLALFAAMAMTAIALVQSKQMRDTHRAAIVLAGATAGFFALLFLGNIAKPMIIFRYLTAAAGPTLVIAAVLGLQKAAPRYTLVMVSVFAIISGVLCIATGKHARDGWDTSAQEVARRVQDCPSTQVFVHSFREPKEELDLLDNAARATGYNYFRDRLGLPINHLAVGGVVPAGSPCPNIFWAEHAFAERNANMTAAQVLDFNQASTTGATTTEYVGDGVIVTITPAAN